MRGETLTLGAWGGGAAEGQPGFFRLPQHMDTAGERPGVRASREWRGASRGSLAFAVARDGQKLASSRCGCQWWLGLPQVASQFTLYIL